MNSLQLFILLQFLPYVLLYEFDRLTGRSAGRKHCGNPGRLQFLDILIRDRAPAEDDDVIRAALPEKLDNFGEQIHVSPRETRQADGIHILLDCGACDHLRGLPEAGVNHLHPRITKRPGDHLGTTIVPIKTWLRAQDPNLLLHLCCHITLLQNTFTCFEIAQPALRKPEGVAPLPRSDSLLNAYESNDDRFGVLAPDLSKDVHDLTLGRVGPNCVENL